MNGVEYYDLYCEFMTAVCTMSQNEVLGTVGRFRERKARLRRQLRDDGQWQQELKLFSSKQVAWLKEKVSRRSLLDDDEDDELNAQEREEMRDDEDSNIAHPSSRSYLKSACPRLTQTTSSSSTAHSQLPQSASPARAASSHHTQVTIQTLSYERSKGKEGEEEEEQEDNYNVYDNYNAYSLDESAKEPAASSARGRVATPSLTEGATSALLTLASEAASRPSQPMRTATTRKAAIVPVHASLTGIRNQPLFTCLDRCDENVCDPRPNIGISGGDRQPAAKYYYPVDLTELSSWFSKGRSVANPFYRPRVSLYAPKDHKACYYIHYRDMDQLFMKIEIQRDADYGELLLWAFDVTEPEYRALQVNGDDMLQMLRLQQLLHMMRIFMSYKSLTTRSDIKHLEYIKVNPYKAGNATEFFVVVVNNRTPYKDPTGIIRRGVDGPVLWLDSTTYERLLGRYILLYEGYHRGGPLPAALTKPTPLEPTQARIPKVKTPQCKCICPTVCICCRLTPSYALASSSRPPPSHTSSLGTASASSTGKRSQPSTNKGEQVHIYIYTLMHTYTHNKVIQYLTLLFYRGQGDQEGQALDALARSVIPC